MHHLGSGWSPTKRSLRCLVPGSCTCSMESSAPELPTASFFCHLIGTSLGPSVRWKPPWATCCPAWFRLEVECSPWSTSPFVPASITVSNTSSWTRSHCCLLLWIPFSQRSLPNWTSATTSCRRLGGGCTKIQDGLESTRVLVFMLQHDATAIAYIDPAVPSKLLSYILYVIALEYSCTTN